MKITQDVREYAAQKEIDEQAALSVGMKEKAEEFVAAGGEIYQGNQTQWLMRGEAIDRGESSAHQ